MASASEVPETRLTLSMLDLYCSTLVRLESPGEDVPTLGTSTLPLLDPRLLGGGGGGALTPPRPENEPERVEFTVPIDGREGYVGLNENPSSA